MRVNRLMIVLVSITLYWFLMDALEVTSGSAAKFMLTALLWVAVIVAITNYITNFRKLRLSFDSNGWRLLNLLLFLNCINIFRSVVGSGETTLTTALGNPYNALALFAPFAVSFVYHNGVLYLLNRYLLLLMVVGSVLGAISIAANGIYITREGISSARHLVYPMVFLIGTIAYLGRVERYAIVCASILLFWYIGIIIGSRATVLRIGFLYLFILLAKLPRNLINRFVYPLLVLSMSAFIYQVISTPLSNDESLFQRSLAYLQNLAGQGSGSTITDKADTRTFLYVEVISDLVDTGNLIFGKGSNGTYYSAYFHQIGVDSDTRLTVEVGFLAYLLKGGVLAALLNITLFLYASYLAIYKSYSRYVKWIGFMLITHVLLLFVENLVSLDLYNLCIWLFVGSCFSKQFLDMTDEKVLRLLRGKRTYIDSRVV